MTPDGTTSAGSALDALDWMVIAGYLVVVLAIGIGFARRASRDTTGFLLAGRSLPWWVAGTSIVATTFSSDTPLQVVKLVRQGGIGENWWWWSMAAGQVAGVFLFAPLWRRSNLITDVGFIGLRYDGRGATILRVVEGLWQGLLVNGVVLASVTVGMATILRIMLDLDPESSVSVGTWSMPVPTLLVGGLAVATVGYSMLSGLYGVAWSDVPQFVIAMVGSIVLAVSVVGELGGPAAMLERLAVQPGVSPRVTSITPDLSDGAAIATVVALFTLNWWSRAPGHGALAQRLLASRDPKSGTLAMAWFVVAHHVLRPWPWILVALASLVLVPATLDPVTGVLTSTISDQEVFPWMIRHHLGPGLRGLLVVSMLGAFMSTVDTHVNLSSAYLLNDVVGPCRSAWRRRRGLDEPPRQDVRRARLLALPVLALVLLVARGFDDIVALYKYLGVIAAGMAPVMILRWYWWRVTAWTEIVGMTAALVIGNLLVTVGPLVPPAGGPDTLFGPRLAATMALAAAAWLPATLLSRPASTRRLARFQRLVGPGGPGWSRFQRRTPGDALGPRLGWTVVGTAAVWMAIVGLGWCVLARPAAGAGLLAAAVVLAIPTVRAAARLAGGPSTASGESAGGS